MQLGERPGERQAEPGPAVAPAQRAVDLAERLQRDGDVLGRHSDPAVLDGEHDRPRIA